MNAEELVRKKDKLTQELNRLESYRNSMRCGRRIEMIRFRFKAGVYGWGWLNESKPKTLPDGMAREFYAFLKQKSEEVGGKLRRVEELLEER